MSSQRPLKFSAGGSKSTKRPPLAPKSPPKIPPAAESNALAVLTTGLTLKRSPWHLQNWIACLLTLDGRDKFTKVLQYSCRLLSWYFGGLAGGNAGTHRTFLYRTLSHRFHLLYQSFVESRKAFRIGRSFIEYDKLRSMGWGEYFMGAARSSPLAEGPTLRRRHGRHRAESIPEHPDEDASDGDHGQESWNEDEEEEEEEEEKKVDDSPKPKVIARPGRPHLPSRVSSNIGWGPGTASSPDGVSAQASTTTTTDSRISPPKRTLSELGTMYRSSRSSSMGWIRKTDEESSSSVAKADDVPPAWKLIGTTFKLVGLMGFWTFDNLAFLTGSGFLDPFSPASGAAAGGDDSKSLRLHRKKRASEWGARFYFMGALAGLYVNVRGIWECWNGALRNVRQEVARACWLRCEKNSLKSTETVAANEEAIVKAKQRLKATETKLFELYVALLKSICDCIVFSNNPGVDLHLKLRGRKNHEGLHCCCGLISAGTVLFGNFPNA